MRLWVGLALMGTGCFVTDAELTAALDRDGDGYLPVQTGGDDCDEGRADIHPGADEVCGDGLDNNCDGVPDDDGIGSRTWFLDDDGDGFGIASTVTACVEPEGYAPVAGDCDDGDPSLNPAAEDLCDGIDQDCDGIVDDAVPLVERYRDADGDGIGTTDETVLACTDVPGFVEVSGDCDDTDATVSPVAVDLCDGVDQDCDGVVDDDAVFTLHFFDGDGDGIGTDLDTIEDCGAVPGYVALGGDCDDTDPTVSPVAVDLCDGIDQDCDGVADDDAVFTAYFLDADGDGVGTSDIGVEACGPAPGFVLASGDCDDGDASISPLVLDGCDGIDNDCDGVVDNDVVRTLYFEDLDGDGVGSSVFEESCAPPPGFVQLTGDCDDTDASVRPDSLDPCDGIDQDCDGAVDEDASFSLWFADVDGDGLGSLVDSLSTCDGAPAGYVATPGDCVDSDPAVTVPTWYEDGDGDGFGTDVTVSGCVMPVGFAAVPGDCDDGRQGVHPSRPEVCSNGRDDDCDPSTDCRWSGTYLLEDLGPAKVVEHSGMDVQMPSVDFLGNAADDLFLWESGQVVVIEGGSGFSPDDTPAATIVGDCTRLLFGADLDGDGRPEFVCVDGSGASVYASGSTGVLVPSMVIAGTFTQASASHISPLPPGVWLVEAGDLIFVPYGPGNFDGSDWTARVNSLPGETIRVVLNFRGEQHDGLAVLSSGLDFHIMESVGLGTHALASAQASFSAGANPIGLSIGDLDGDGTDDLVIGDLQLTPFQISTSTRFGPLDSPMVASETFIEGIPGSVFAPVIIGDSDGDGLLETATLSLGSGPMRVGVHFGGEPLGYATDADAFIVSGVPDETVGSLEFGDFDGDGYSDLVIDTDAGVRVLWGTGQ